MAEAETPSRASADRARLDRIEQRQDDMERAIHALESTVGRVEQNQAHAEELNRLRFNSLDTAVLTLSTDLKGFMARIEAMISGEVETSATRQGRQLVEDYKAWRREISMQVDTLTDSIERTDAVAAALVKSRQSTGVWVRSTVPWILTGAGIAIGVVGLLNGAR